MEALLSFVNEPVFTILAVLAIIAFALFIRFVVIK